jgi:hypothetical protein
VQVVPTVKDGIVAFELNLRVGTTEKHDLLVPVTVSIKLPTSFPYNSNYSHSIRHDKEDGTYESLPLTISGGYASFTTSSFSTFTLIATANSTSTTDDDHHHTNSSSNSNSGTVIPSTATFISDTTVDFGVKGAYQFKITSTNGQVPTLVLGTAGVFSTVLVKSTGNDYFIKLIAIGAPGAKSGVYVNGVKLLVATVTTTAVVAPVAPAVKSDTNGSFKVKAGQAYTFKITANSKPTFTVGTASAFKVVLVKVVGKDYFIKVTATGKAGTGSGFFVNSKRTAAATIIK